MCPRTKFFFFFEKFHYLGKIEKNLNYFRYYFFSFDLPTSLEATAETSNKLVSVVAGPQFVYFVNEKHRSGVSSLHILDEVTKVVQLGLAFSSFSPFYSEINVQIGRMISGGFFNYWRSFFFPKPLNVKSESIGPQVLTMDHMEVAFIASLLPLTLAISAFMTEVSIRWIKIFIPRVRAFFVIKAFYKLRHNV